MLKARKFSNAEFSLLLNFPNPPFFEAPVRGNPLEFCDEIWRQKTRIMGLPDGEVIMIQYRLVTDIQTRCNPYYPREHGVAR